VNFYRRRLPHLHVADQPTFLTWRLHDSLPPNRCFRESTLSSGRVFAALDRLLDEGRTGPLYLRQPAIADIVVEVVHYCATVLRHYTLHAFAVMPNHVHVLLSPHVPLAKLTKSLKGFTAKRANQMLARTGTPFWQEESYDRLIRDRQEFERVRRYIEENPVRAGLAREASEYRWSSAGWARWATGRSPADQEVRPTM
jgi:putative transposase